MDQFRFETLNKLDLLLEGKEIINIISETNASKEDAKAIINLLVDEISKVYKPNEIVQSKDTIMLGRGIPKHTYGGVNFDLLPEGVYMLTVKNKEVFTKKNESWCINEEYKIVSELSKGDTIKKLEELRDSIS